MLEPWKHFWERGGRLRLSSQHGLVRCEPDWCWDPPQFTDWDLWIVLDGVGHIRIQDEEHAVTQGFSVCFSPGDWRVSATHDRRHPLQVFYCHFKVSEKSIPPNANPFLPRPLFREIDSHLWTTVRELSGVGQNTPPSPYHELLLWQLLLKENASAPVQRSSSEDRVRLQVRQLKEDPTTNRGIEQMAREAGLSAGHYRRIFKKVTGESPVQFMIHCRIERAVYYLRETRLSIDQIGSIVGYRDIYFFSRQFKEVMGCSPSVFRHCLY